jgi:hypothetical protein
VAESTSKTLPERQVIALEAIATDLKRIADRFDSDAAVFSEMVKAGRNLGVPRQT